LAARHYDDLLRRSFRIVKFPHSKEYFVPVTPVNPSPHIAFRLITLLFAVLLFIQCIWLLLAEFSRPGIDRLPTDVSAADIAAQKRDAAIWAASIGVIRGDLWADSAFTYTNLILDESRDSWTADITPTLGRARAISERAVDLAPTQFGAWLVLAGLAARYPSPGFTATEALKMSYYTGPSEPDLVPLRLRIATYSDVLTDIELRQFATRDLRLLLARHEKSAIAVAYNAASPPGKRFIEQTVGEIDPSALVFLRAEAQKQSLPH
jgi:hypothetical protein